MKKKILVVDNHPLILKFMTTLLEKNGHTVMTAEDGLDALDVLNKFKPEIMFVDLVMPHISGYKLCRIIRNMPGLKEVYLIILSAVAEEEAENFTEFGADACIAKGPFNEMASHVLAAIDESTRKSQGRDLHEIRGSRDFSHREITKELLLSKKHSELILNNLSEGILELAAEGKIIYANSAVTRLIGISETALLGSDFVEMFHRDDRERINKMMKMGWIPEKSGDSVVTLNNILISVNFIQVTGEEQNSFIVILENVTERIRLEEEKMKIKKLESFGLIAGGVAHDFNNLLTVILGNINLAQMKTTSEDPVAAALREAEKASLQAKDLTEKFITFSSGGKPDKKPSSIKELIDNCVAGLRNASNVTCRCSLPDVLWNVAVDQGQMKQAFCNILQNAGEAMPKGGVIEIAAENVTVDSVRKDTGLPVSSGGYVKICIRDKGIGIPEENIEKIFDPYFTTRDRWTQKGLGLGLVITHSIIKKHEGYIRVESKVGKGTHFYIYLPAYDEDSAG